MNSDHNLAISLCNWCCVVLAFAWTEQRVLLTVQRWQERRKKRVVEQEMHCMCPAAAVRVSVHILDYIHTTVWIYESRAHFTIEVNIIKMTKSIAAAATASQAVAITTESETNKQKKKTKERKIYTHTLRECKHRVIFVSQQDQREWKSERKRNKNQTTTKTENDSNELMKTTQQRWNIQNIAMGL